jgi:hypothetical protein
LYDFLTLSIAGGQAYILTASVDNSLLDDGLAMP